MSKVVLTIGASASGKSSWADQWVKENDNWTIVNRDDVRFAIHNHGVRDWTSYKFNKTNEKAVTEYIDEFVLNNVVAAKKNLIVADTNLNPHIREKWIAWAKEFGYEFEQKLFPCKWEELVKRNSNRQGGLSESILWDQYMRFEQQFGTVKLYDHDYSLDDYTVICDIDGTIADMKGIRGPFDWNMVKYDRPRNDIIHIVESIGSVTGHITFMSGRDGISYNHTKDWINANVNLQVPWELLMRDVADVRPDWTIKDELYENHIRGKANVLAVIDDRRQMIRHWTLKNMPGIIDVGKYNVEF